MSNSTTSLYLLSFSQGQKETSANRLWDAMSPAALFGKADALTAGLTWGYYGGTISISGTPTQIANGTVALTASATNYVETNASGVVTSNTTGWTGGLTRLYSVVTGSASITSYIDYRTPSISGGGGSVTSVGNAAPAAGLTISGTNPITATGTWTFALANDLAALEGLASTGFAARTGADAWAQRTLQAPAAGITIANPAGVAGDPTFALANDLGALEGLSGTGYAKRTGADAWSVGTAISLTADVSGILPVANGGTGLASGTSGGIPYYSASGTLASSAALAANQIVLGGGAGVTPATLGSLGTTTTVLHGNAAGAPTFAAVSLTADVSGTLPVANGGTGATSGTVAFLGNNNAFTKAQAVAWSTLTDAATIAVDASLSNNFVVTLAGNRTLGAPTSLTDGQVINLMTIQDATGSRTLAYNSVYKFAGGTATVLSTAANAVDMQTFVYRSSTGFLYNTGAVKALA